MHMLDYNFVIAVGAQLVMVTLAIVFFAYLFRES